MDRKREDQPLLFAATKNNLGSALFQFGQITGNRTYYMDAASAFRQALETYLTENHPKMAAIAEKNLDRMEELVPALVDESGRGSRGRAGVIRFIRTRDRE